MGRGERRAPRGAALAAACSSRAARAAGGRLGRCMDISDDHTRPPGRALAPKSGETRATATPASDHRPHARPAPHPLPRPQNIDTDQIIPAEYLTLVPSKPDEYEKLGSFALIGLPEALYPTRFVEDGSMKTRYPIVIGGDNFRCGSSREHAPVAMGAAGARVVVAQSYARIFFRNCVAT